MMTILQLETHDDPEAGWAWAERGKSRWLLERIAGETAEPPEHPATIRHRLPADTTLLEFAVLSDRIAFWALTAESTHHGQIPLDRGTLRRRVEELRRAIFEGGKRFAESSRNLFEILIEPAAVPRGHRLVIVPDEDLSLVPFAALLDTTTGRFLVEDHTLTTAPSAAIFLATLDRVETVEPFADATALAVGDPAFDPERFPFLERLPEAAEEARELVSLYPGSELRVEREATVSAFLEAVPRHRLVQFSGHARVRSRGPLFSKLLLAPGAAPEDTGELFARDLYGLELRNVDLLILSACETGTGYSSSLEGRLSLAHPFLAAGVPTVLATLWDVHDRTSRHFLGRFHAHLRTSDDPATALRRAQLDFLASDDPVQAPSHWATFQLIGTTRAFAERKEHQ